MKNLTEYIQESSKPYTVTLKDNGKEYDVTIILSNPKDAKNVDKWLENHLGGDISSAMGGPNNIEFPF